MDIISDKKHTIYRKDFDNRTSYSIGLAKKKQDGNYENGYMNVVFNKDVELENKTQILIKKAWLDFYTKDKVTHLFIRISDFETIGYLRSNNEPNEEPQKSIDKWESAKEIEIDDESLPFY